LHIARAIASIIVGSVISGVIRFYFGRTFSANLRWYWMSVHFSAANIE